MLIRPSNRVDSHWSPTIRAPKKRKSPDFPAFVFISTAAKPNSKWARRTRARRPRRARWRRRPLLRPSSRCRREMWNRTRSRLPCGPWSPKRSRRTFPYLWVSLRRFVPANPLSFDRVSTIADNFLNLLSSSLRRLPLPPTTPRRLSSHFGHFSDRIRLSSGEMLNA